MYTVDIDVGGTLADGIFSDGQKLECIKVDTTPHDLTVCLMDCLGQGAARLGFPGLSAFLEEVELIRWSTTVTSNVLAELRGPKIGLLVNQGHEKNLYGPAQLSPALNRLISERDVIGLDDSPQETDVMNAVRFLLEGGARRICVSLRGALHNPEPERWISGIVERQYPDHFLGSVPVLAGSEICKNSDDATRTYYALINAYTHGALAATLFKAEDELRQSYGFLRPFLISHINGGVAGVAKTKAIDTIESGPVLGMHASSYLAKVYGLDRLVALDVGGTTAKVGVVQDGQPVYFKPADFFGIPVGVSLPYLRSIALGGGSVVKVCAAASAQQKILLGPESMGSYPGPACYGLGGDQPTLTDAFVAAGLIDPDYFLGGAKPIDREMAQSAIADCVARPLGVTVEEAARAVIDRAFDLVAGLIANASSELRREFTDHSLLAYGGNGGLFACGAAERVGARQVYLLSLGPVFSAFGSAVSDIRHVYERAVYIPLTAGADISGLNPLLEEMKGEALKDLLGEAIKPEHLAWSVELEVSCDGCAATLSPPPEFDFRSAGDLQKFLPAAWEAALRGDSKMHLELVRVGVSKPIPKPALLERSIPKADSAPALVGSRPVAYGSSKGKAQIYRWERLRPGDVIHGCAVLESANSTYFVPEGWILTIDTYGNGRAVRE